MGAGLVTSVYAAVRAELAEVDDADPLTRATVRDRLGRLLTRHSLRGLRDPREAEAKRRGGVSGSLFGLVAGVAIVIAGFVSFNLTETDAETTGTVIDYEERRSTTTDGGARTSCSFDVAAQIDGERVVITEAGSIGSHCRFDAGDEIAVHYQSDDPSVSYYGDPANERLRTLVLLIGFTWSVLALFRIAMWLYAAGYGFVVGRAGRAEIRSAAVVPDEARERAAHAEATIMGTLFPAD